MYDAAARNFALVAVFWELVIRTLPDALGRIKKGYRVVKSNVQRDVAV